MIHLGLDNQAKDRAVARYCAANGIKSVVILSPVKYRFDCSVENHEHIEWSEIIQYKFFYRLLQEINPETLIVVNECLRSQNRYDLTYNCIRHFLNQTGHQMIFQYLPIIEDKEDFMILFDFDTRSQWKREKFRVELLAEARIRIEPVSVQFNPLEADTSNQLKTFYEKEKERLIAGIGLKDPHTIPRNLYLLGGKAKLLAADPTQWHIGRNNRFKLERMQTYKESAYPNQPYVVFEFCHNFIDFADLMAMSGQSAFGVLMADLKIDRWYLARYREWGERLKNVSASLQRREERSGGGA